ncbi:repressor [Marinomonas ushuaiensis DSM 15871]|uniref:Repressor n=1 Tax=Marinomonas ushuaiensis DSM 15871 TaxID=1122207 RepID=X7E6P1_9GAMM|nr:S24 family peptidase [Marinomonas ushuaiensis]ETX11627.1 repressor [Marinomonas ushuaiensis DSM 15871]
MTIADRVKEKRAELGLTQAELAKRVGISQQSLQKIEDGGTQNPRKLLNLAKELKCTPEWLQLGYIGEVRENASSYLDNIAYQGHFNKRPVIRDIQSIDWSKANDFNSQEEWLEVSSGTSQDAFWLTVSGDSMMSTSGISISEKHLILVEPQQTAHNGDMVIVRMKDRNEVAFKKLVIDTGLIYLASLNSSYRPIEMTDNFSFIGIVKEARLLL